jgi:hypothetical protein
LDAPLEALIEHESNKLRLVLYFLISSWAHESWKKSTLAHVSWRSPIIVSLNLFILSLVTRPYGTSNGCHGVEARISQELWFVISSSLRGIEITPKEINTYQPEWFVLEMMKGPFFLIFSIKYILYCSFLSLIFFSLKGLN